MRLEPNALARQLRGASNWRAEWNVVAEAVSGEPSTALAVAEAIDAELASRADTERGADMALKSVRRGLLQLLGRSPDPAATGIAVDLALRGPLRRDYAALVVVGTRPAAEVWDALATEPRLRDVDPEFGLFLVHELVVRGVEAQPAADHYTAWAEESGHELALLPERLLPVERHLPKRGIFWPGSRGTGRVLDSRSERRPSVRLGDVVPGIGPRIVDIDKARLHAPFRSWTGASEAEAFERDTVFPFDAATPELRAEAEDFEHGLPFDAMTPQLRAEALGTMGTPDQLCDLLYGCASGARRPNGGGLARLWMWEAISAVVGSSWPSPIEQLDEALHSTTQVWLDPDEWFDEHWLKRWVVIDAAATVVVIATGDEF